MSNLQTASWEAFGDQSRSWAWGVKIQELVTQSFLLGYPKKWKMEFIYEMRFDMDNRLALHLTCISQCLYHALVLLQMSKPASLNRIKCVSHLLLGWHLFVYPFVFVCFVIFQEGFMLWLVFMLILSGTAAGCLPQISSLYLAQLEAFIWLCQRASCVWIWFWNSNYGLTGRKNIVGSNHNL